MRTALPKVPCGSLDSVASTCDAPGRRDAQFGKPWCSAYTLYILCACTCACMCIFVALSFSQHNIQSIELYYLEHLAVGPRLRIGNAHETPSALVDVSCQTKCFNLLLSRKRTVQAAR
ncbi:hypothetical protein EVAR_20361_1 [Eumeta japonica]|uniref:Uncharacterized protein n=1 Tax=Eumeta variegata TaxID=151549 RepID=A0A4C1VS85_EUMVA|nr:hypothetical protein EVAR_20361_1 [Eumeta japonica]